MDANLIREIIRDYRFRAVAVVCVEIPYPHTLCVFREQLKRQ
jgi:hypothetical protein